MRAGVDTNTESAADSGPHRAARGTQAVEMPASVVSDPVTYRWVILAVLWITYVVVFLSRLSVGPLAPFFRDELGIGSTQVGLVMSAAALGYTLTQIPVGWFVDRIGARWPIAIGEVIAGLCMIGVSMSTSYGWLLGLMLATGMGCGFLMPATTQAVVVWFPRRERATVMGVKQTAVNIGGIVGAATLPVVAVAWGWRTGFLGVGLLAIAIALLSLLFYRDPERGVAASTAIPNQTAPAATGAQRPSLRALMRQRNIWLVATAGLFMNWVEMAILGHFVLYGKDVLGLSAIFAGGLLATAETAGAISRPASGVVSDWLFHGARKPVFLIFAVLATALCLLVALAGHDLGKLLYPVVFLLGIGTVGFGAIFFTMISEFGGRTGAGTASALGSTVSMVGSIVGPPAFGLIVDASGSYRLAWLSLMLFGAIAVAALLMVREDQQDV
jgi:MFS transporter, ACS family, hexuronate transporter